MPPKSYEQKKKKKKRFVQRIDFASLKYIFCMKQAADLCSNKPHYLSLNVCSLITFALDYLDTIRNNTLSSLCGFRQRYDRKYTSLQTCLITLFLGCKLFV